MPNAISFGICFCFCVSLGWGLYCDPIAAKAAQTDQGGVQAYWDSLKVNFKKTVKPDETYPLPKSLSYRLLGYIEAKYEIKVPSAWEACLTRGSISSHRKIDFLRTGDLDFDLLNFDYDWDKCFSQESRENSVRITTTQGKETRTLDVPKKLFSQRYLTSAIIGDDKSYLAFIDRTDVTGRVICVDTKTGIVSWESEMKDYISEWYRGSTEYFIQLASNSDSVLLFHICDLGCLIEQIRKSDGSKTTVLDSTDLEDVLQKELDLEEEKCMKEWERLRRGGKLNKGEKKDRS